MKPYMLIFPTAVLVICAIMLVWIVHDLNFHEVYVHVLPTVKAVCHG